MSPGPAALPTAVRLRLRDGATVVGILPARAQVPVPVRGAVVPPPHRWSGLPARFSAAGLRDDVVWFAQLCGDPRPRVSLVWVGRVPGFPDALRLERVTCHGRSVGRFLTGTSGSAVVLAADHDSRARLAAYAAVVTPLRTLGHAYVVVVGSRAVSSITVGGERRRTRVVVVRLEQAGSLQVRAADGTRFPLR